MWISLGKFLRDVWEAKIGVMLFIVLLSARGKPHGFLLWKSVLGNIMQDVSLVYTTYPSKACSLHLAFVNNVSGSIHC